MIRTTVHTQNGMIVSVVLTGHAGAGPYGQDLVCAGASSIMTGALNALDILFPEECSLSMSDNRMEAAAETGNEQLQAVLRTVVIQLETMAEQFPDHIKVIRKEV